MFRIDCFDLQENATVRSLILEGNHLSRKSCHYLAIALKENSSVETLVSDVTLNSSVATLVSDA